MYKIISAEFLAQDIKRFVISAPKIAAKRKAGQFVILRINTHGERIPITISDSSTEDGTITIIVQGVGKSTKEINLLESGDSFQDVVGPLGKPSHLTNFGRAVVIGGGLGTAIAYPIAKELSNLGNYTIGISGARNKDLVILEKELSSFCNELHIMTDDGTYGEKGFVTAKLKELIDSLTPPDFVLAIGPIPMMRAVAELTRPNKIHTVVSLNPVMVDGTGMCGGCRAVVDNKTVFVCVDGPEFDAHLVDFDILTRRNKTYNTQEKEALHQHTCKTEQAIKQLSHQEIESNLASGGTV